MIYLIKKSKMRESSLRRLQNQVINVITFVTKTIRGKMAQINGVRARQMMEYIICWLFLNPRASRQLRSVPGRNMGMIVRTPRSLSVLKQS